MSRLISFFLFLICCCAFSQAQIVEIHEFKELASYVKPNTVIVLDIDDTLFIPEQMLGCDEWFLSRAKKNKERYENPDVAFEKTLAEFEAIRHLCTMRPVEDDTAQIVKKLQEEGHTVMCLTTQGLGLATRTVHQLKAHEIDPSLTAPHPEDLLFTVKNHSVLYRRGILFTSGTHKGQALFTLLDEIGLSPERILFINDKKTHLQEIAATAAQRGVEFTGLRYGYSDYHKRAFWPDIAEIQFTRSSFDHILSDEEAIQLLKAIR